jgi:hypothetical protein
LQEKLKEREQFGDLGVDGKIILQEVLGRTIYLRAFDMAKAACEIKVIL